MIHQKSCSEAVIVGVRKRARVCFVVDSIDRKTDSLKQGR